MVYGPNCSTKDSEDSGKKFNVLLRLWQTGKRFRNRQTGIRRGEAKFLVRDGRLGQITRRQTKQGISDRRGRYQEDRQENAGKTCMAKNNLAKE